MWSAAVFDPAFPGRSMMASGSPDPSGAVVGPGGQGVEAEGLLPCGAGLSFSNSHRFASRCARQHLQRTGWLAADAGGAFEAVAVDVVGEVADEPGVLHAEGGGGELGVQVGDELGDPGLPAQRRRGARRAGGPG